MTYEFFSHLAGTWGLVMLVAMFFVAIVYALWPSNTDKFSRASSLPLDEVELSQDDSAHTK